MMEDLHLRTVGANAPHEELPQDARGIHDLKVSNACHKATLPLT
jgi:hypothetical protein